MRTKLIPYNPPPHPLFLCCLLLPQPNELLTTWFSPTKHCRLQPSQTPPSTSTAANQLQIYRTTTIFHDFVCFHGSEVGGLRGGFRKWGDMAMERPLGWVEVWFHCRKISSPSASSFRIFSFAEAMVIYMERLLGWFSFPSKRFRGFVQKRFRRLIM